MAEPQRRSFARLQVAGVLVSVVSLAGVVAWALHQPAPRLPSDGSELASLLAAIGLVGVTTGLRSERWRLLIERAGGRISRLDSHGLTAVGFMGNSVLPARGGDALRVMLARSRSASGGRTIVGTLLAERLLDVLFLLSTFAVLAFVVLRDVETPRLGTLVLLLAALPLAALAAWLVLRVRGSRRWARNVAGFLAPMTTSTRDLLSRGHGASMLALTAAVWLGDAAVWLAASFATGLDLAPIDALYLVALASVFVLIPAGPGYAGTLDAGVIFGVRALGGSGGAALSYLLVLRFVLVVPLTVVGLLLVLTRYGGVSSFRARSEGRPA